MQERKTGILCPMFSIFGDYGVGNFSDNAKYFIDLIKQAGFSYWQILPINSVGKENSPYDICSAFAGNILFIDPNQLKKLNLILKTDLENARYDGSIYFVDYKFSKKNILTFLEIAFNNITEELNIEFETFCKKQDFWLENYCFYEALREKYNVLSWQDFPKEIKFKYKVELKKEKDNIKNRIDFFKFSQFIFFKQWFELKKYANKKGVKIIGDVPFYVSLYSADVFFSPENFRLDENLEPINVAGVPPDYFSKNGQKWDYPLYNFKNLEKTKFKWFKKRFQLQLEMFDVLRLDHFIAYDKFYSIPYDANNAKNGQWEDGIGKLILPNIVEKYGADRFIAEDLGAISKRTEKFINDLKIKGMNVFQFGFIKDNSTNLPHNYNATRVSYTGTHDNNTTLGWLYELDKFTRQKVFDYINYNGTSWGKGGFKNTSIKAIITSLYMSNASLVILPIQDVLAYGSDTRINIPGKTKDNWKFRLTLENFKDVDFNFFINLTKKYYRS